MTRNRVVERLNKLPREYRKSADGAKFLSELMLTLIKLNAVEIDIEDNNYTKTVLNFMAKYSPQLKDSRIALDGIDELDT